MQSLAAGISWERGENRPDSLQAVIPLLLMRDGKFTLGNFRTPSEHTCCVYNNLKTFFLYEETTVENQDLSVVRGDKLKSHQTYCFLGLAIIFIIDYAVNYFLNCSISCLVYKFWSLFPKDDVLFCPQPKDIQFIVIEK